MFYVAGAAVAAGGGYLASKESAEAQEEAAQTQAEAARSAEDTQMEMYRQSREDVSPWMEAGKNVLPQLEYMATGRQPMVTDPKTGEQRVDPDFSPMDVQQSPIFQFRQQQGEEAINRALAARGQFDSSYGVNRLAELTNKLTAEETAKQYDRLFNMAGMGQNAATQTGTAALQTGNAIASTEMAAGEAQAQGIRGAGEQRASMYSSLGALPMEGFNAYQQSQAYQPQTQQPQPQGQYYGGIQGLDTPMSTNTLLQ